MIKKIILAGLLLLIVVNKNYSQSSIIKNKKMSNNYEVATLANGCFWCTEAVFQRLKGVESVMSGYTGGTVQNPTYREVTTGETGHAEAIQIYFNPKEISYIEILDVFFSTHNPTTLNRQGNDIGTQYRSAIFYHSEEQKTAAQKFIKELTEAKVFNNPIVTEVTKFKEFYKAEDYHQNYYNNNKYQGYCMIIINPKLEKFRKKFKEKLKE